MRALARWIVLACAACTGSARPSPGGTAPTGTVSSVSDAAAPVVFAADGGSPRGEPAVESHVRKLVEPEASAYLQGKGGVMTYDLPVHCALDDAAEVSCTWGSIRTPIRGLSGAIDLVAGHNAVCALTKAGGVACLDTSTRTDEAKALKIPFVVRRIVANEFGLVLEDAKGAVHACELEGGREGEDFVCQPKAVVGVPDADGFATGPLRTCRLDAARKVACKGRFSDSDDGDVTIATPDFPVRVRRLVAGMGAYESGTVICAVGAGGEVACFRSLRPAGKKGGATAEVVTFPLLGPASDIAIGDTYVRVVLVDGSVYEIPASATRAYPAGARPFAPILVPLPEPAGGVGRERCVLLRSGRVTCASRPATR